MKNDFSIDKHEIDEIFTAYQQRKTNEEIEHLNSKHGGLAGLATKLKTSLENGISPDSLKAREEAFDNNVRYREPMPPFWFYIKDAFNDETLQILCVCAIIEISIGLSPMTENPGKDAFDGIGIVFAICVIVITTAVTNYNKEKKFKQLSDENFKKFTVVTMREGSKMNISDEELLVGDKCKIDMGMMIPADGIIITASNLKVDESSLTGESNLMRKEPLDKCNQPLEDGSRYPSAMVFSGTTVKEGEGWMLVLATGGNSAAGKIREHVMQNKEDEESNQTPLELKLADIAELIGQFGLWSAIFTLVALLLKLFYSKYTQLMRKNEMLTDFIQKQFHNGTFANTAKDKIANQTYYLIDNTYSIWSGLLGDIFQSVILCITIVVVAIPEGLPLAVTLSLSFSVKKMMDDNNLVRHMPACETMGGADYICTDKTGTLTRNKMHVVSVYNNSSEIDVNDIDSEHKMNYTYKFNDKYYQSLRDSLVNNIDIEVDGEGEIIMASSSKTDFAFFDLLRGFNENILKKQKQLERIKFHSDRKRMSTIVKRDDGKYVIYMKGAPEVIFGSCSYFLKPNGEGLGRIAEEDRHKLDDVTRKYSELTLRNLAIAMKEITAEELENFRQQKEKVSHCDYDIEKRGFTLVGIAAINDALRPGVPHSMELCHKAYVTVIMITGDDIRIAEAIARNAGIINSREEYLSITGKEFIEKIGGIVCKTCTMETSKCTCPKTIGQAKLKFGEDKDEEFLQSKLKKERIHDMETFKEVIKHLRIIARARAIDKYALVLGLRELEHVVAVTGDGTNDASALSKADVGFAMGKCGTDVARDAADIIILDDNFNSIVHAIKWGRNIFDNIRKFIQFQLSVNFSAVLLVFVSSCIGSESPITAIQMLWINLIMDSLGSLALSTEDPSDELLYRRPHSRRESIINPTMWKMVIMQSMVQFSLVLFLYLYAPTFVQEDDPERIKLITQFENCFGDFPGESAVFRNHKMFYYIMDGKKALWNPLKRIRRNLDPKFCMFFDHTQFKEDQITNLFEGFKWYMANYGNTPHMTMIFNTFVFYSLFNQISCRVIDNKLNIFHRILGNWLFVAVTSIEMFIQFLIVQYGGLIFKCAVGGLTYSQWTWCLSLAAITFGVNFIMKFIYLEVLCQIDCSQILCCKGSNNEDLEAELVEGEDKGTGERMF